MKDEFMRLGDVMGYNMTKWDVERIMADQNVPPTVTTMQAYEESVANIGHDRAEEIWQEQLRQEEAERLCERNNWESELPDPNEFIEDLELSDEEIDDWERHADKQHALSIQD